MSVKKATAFTEDDFVDEHSYCDEEFDEVSDEDVQTAPSVTLSAFMPSTLRTEKKKQKRKPKTKPVKAESEAAVSQAEEFVFVDLPSDPSTDEEFVLVESESKAVSKAEPRIFMLTSQGLLLEEKRFLMETIPPSEQQVTEASLVSPWSVIFEFLRSPRSAARVAQVCVGWEDVGFYYWRNYFHFHVGMHPPAHVASLLSYSARDYRAVTGLYRMLARKHTFLDSVRYFPSDFMFIDCDICVDYHKLNFARPIESVELVQDDKLMPLEEAKRLAEEKQDSLVEPVVEEDEVDALSDEDCESKLEFSSLPQVVDIIEAQEEFSPLPQQVVSVNRLRGAISLFDATWKKEYSQTLSESVKMLPRNQLSAIISAIPGFTPLKVFCHSHLSSYDINYPEKLIVTASQESIVLWTMGESTWSHCFPAPLTFSLRQLLAPVTVESLSADEISFFPSLLQNATSYLCEDGSNPQIIRVINDSKQQIDSIRLVSASMSPHNRLSLLLTFASGDFCALDVQSCQLLFFVSFDVKTVYVNSTLIPSSSFFESRKVVDDIVEFVSFYFVDHWLVRVSNKTHIQLFDIKSGKMSNQFAMSSNELSPIVSLHLLNDLLITCHQSGACFIRSLSQAWKKRICHLHRPIVKSHLNANDGIFVIITSEEISRKSSDVSMNCFMLRQLLSAEAKQLPASIAKTQIYSGRVNALYCEANEVTHVQCNKHLLVFILQGRLGRRVFALMWLQPVLIEILTRQHVGSIALSGFHLLLQTQSAVEMYHLLSSTQHPSTAFRNRVLALEQQAKVQQRKMEYNRRFQQQHVNSDAEPSTYEKLAAESRENERVLSTIHSKYMHALAAAQNQYNQLTRKYRLRGLTWQAAYERARQETRWPTEPNWERMIEKGKDKAAKKAMQEQLKRERAVAQKKRTKDRKYEREF